MALLGRFINKLFVRAQVVGDVHLSVGNNAVYVLENGRVEHRELLALLLRDRGCEFPNRQLLSADRRKYKALLYRLESLVEKLEFTPDAPDIQLIPVSVYHGHLPNRSFSWWRFLLAEREGITSWWGRLIQLLFNGRQTIIQLDKALSLRALMELQRQQTSGVMAAKVVDQLQAHFLQRRAATFGPVLKKRKHLITELVASADVQRAIHQMAVQQSKEPEQIEKLARRELRKMAANLSPSVARFIGLGLTRFYQKVYRQVRVEGMEDVRQMAKTHQMIYLPCHRSHMDYLLVSWTLHNQGLMLPYVVAGDNLNAPVLGGLLRRGGAIFMRRSFREDPLYSALFKAYMMKMHNAGHALEYFIEGGRSRTGRLLSPKLGVLSLTIEAAKSGQGKPIALVPVWVGYDKLTENRSYQAQLAGEGKKSESFAGLLRSLKLFKGRQGDAVISYAKPIELDQHLSKYDDLAMKSKLIGQDVMKAINKAAYVTETSLLATVLLTQSRQRMGREHLISQVNQLSSLLLQLPARPVGTAKGNVEQWIEDAAARGQLQISAQDVYLDNEQAAEMTFYRNQIQHLTLFIGIYLLFAKRYPKANIRTVSAMIISVYPFLTRSLFWPWEAKQLPEIISSVRDVLLSQQLIEQKEGVLEVRSTSLSVVMMQSAEPYLLRYYIVFRLLERCGSICESDLVDEGVRIAAALHMEFGFRSPEYSDSRSILGFVKNLKEQGMIKQCNEKLSLAVDIAPLMKRSRQVLLKSYVDLIESNTVVH